MAATGTLAIELTDNHDIGLLVGGSVGLAFGEYIGVGISAGINWQAKTVEDLSGVGFNAGVVAFGSSMEYNWAAPSDYFDNPDSELKDGANGAMPFMGVGAGGGAYFEYGGMALVAKGSLDELVDNIYEKVNSARDEFIKTLDSYDLGDSDFAKSLRDRSLDDIISKDELKSYVQDLIDQAAKEFEVQKESDTDTDTD